MREDFLHYIWQHQYFDRTELLTTVGEKLLVVQPGQHNTDAGPDFMGAHLHLNEVKWAGSVEIHLKASDWFRHQHQTDPKYDQVILHVVWENDVPVLRTDQTEIPTLELRERVPRHLLFSYQNLLRSTTTIPCAPFVQNVPDITRKMMLGRTLMERVEEKAAVVTEQYVQSGKNWETTTYQVLAAAFGFKINQEPFRRLSRALPLPVLMRHRHDGLQTEALLFGQAGFLAHKDTPQDEYIQKLRREHTHLAHKYGLGSEVMQKSDWNFLRLRPSNFPTVRLAQFAALLGVREHLFSGLLQGQRLADFENFFRVSPSAYWQGHYRPGRSSSRKAKGMGITSIHNLISNTVVPLLVAYSRQTGNVQHTDKALALLEQLPAEHNRITRLYEDLPFAHRAAADSQAFLSLYRQYCQPRRCLACAIGNKILKHHLSAS